MATTLETRACKTCATAKRRCGKEMPSCLRCRERANECTCPLAKSTCFVLCKGDDVLQVESEICPSINAQPSTPSPDLQIRGADSSTLSFGQDLPQPFSELVCIQRYSSWFTSPETWTIDRFLLLEYNSSTIVGLKRLLVRIHQWLTDWVEKGSNPFIHAQLYGSRFPRCIQDAYTALSCYLHKRASNEQNIARIIEDRATQLVAENSISPTDSFEHLARVQALLVYQVLCLYDGDIRLRHIAESNIAVLYSWMEQMAEHASHAICLGSSVISSAHYQAAADSSLSDSQYENLLWYSWILAESIRRTWLVTSGIQGAYLVIQQGRAIPCQGGMMITTRQGVWEAQSVRVWEKLCSEVNVGLMQVAEADKLFIEVTPADVDDFTMLILQATFGEEKMERWGMQTQH